MRGVGGRDAGSRELVQPSRRSGQVGATCAPVDNAHRQDCGRREGQL
jgi:hypothetical protein